MMPAWPFEKLVRRHVPDQLRARGERIDTRIAKPEEMLRLLRDKLIEEVSELVEAIDAVRDKEDRAHFGDAPILGNVRWSGNTSRVDDERRKRVVIYVALYGEGRVAARTEKEFEESIGDGAPSLRFERIGD